MTNLDSILKSKDITLLTKPLRLSFPMYMGEIICLNWVTQDKAT